MPTILRSPVKPRIIEWRVNIPFEQLENITRLILLFGSIAGLLFWAEYMRRQNGVGWFDFFGKFNRFGIPVTVITERSRKAGPLVTMMALSAGGIILWITLDLMNPEEKPKMDPFTPPPQISDVVPE